ncbi:MAG: class I SAM-dependent methyltransferase [Acidobacteriia bacterium]|nr:class I SAM-dependent methyltransferase [Terriglobia bacterium]
MDGTTQAREADPVSTPFDDGELYDVLFGEFRFDLDFYLELARKARGPVLEVACGTGRILIPCVRAGVDIDGLDLFPAMLGTLRRKAAALGFAPTLHRSDMRSFAVPRRYALVFCAFNGFVHCLTTEDQLQALRTWRGHLAPGGAVVFNVFYPGREFLSGPEGEPVLEGETRHPVTGLPVRIYDTRTFDRVAQVQHSCVEIQELDDQGRVATAHRSETDMRWTFKPEMELLLAASGFARWEICGDFDRRPLTRDNDQMIVFAWNDPPPAAASPR